MYQLKFSLETLSPVVLSAMSNSTIMTKTHDEISGSIIRGVLASKYVDEKNLGKNAYKDEDFKNLFYGGLKFLPANPEIFEKRTFVLPLSLQRGKKGTDDANKVQDILTEENPAKGFKSFRGLGFVDGEKISKVEVNKNIFMHMSRSSESERLSGKSEDGNIYNYESLDAEQKFSGVIIGGKDELEKLNLEKNSLSAYIGRSRFTQYGRCLLTFDTIEEIELPKVGEKIYLRLETPLVPSEDFFIGAEKILSAEVVENLNDLCGKKIFELGQVFASNIEIENFVVPWGMKRPRITALAAGTVFELKTLENLSDSDLKILGEKIFSGFGMRTEEGFGQARLWESKNFTYVEVDENKIAEPENFSEQTVKIAEKILMARCLEQIRIDAYEDAEKLKPQLKRGNFTHFFARLDGILSGVLKTEDVRKKFAEQLELEIRDGSLFKEHLKDFSMSNGQKFFDVLTCKADFPRKFDDLEKYSDLIKKLEIKNLDFAKNKFFAEYMQNYFRYARKFAAGGGEE